MTATLPKQVQKQLADAEQLLHVAAEDSSQDDTPAVEESTETPQVPVQSEEPWEHKFRVLQGKYDAEVPRLDADNKRLTAEINNLHGLLSTLSQQPRPQQQADTTAYDITEAEIKDYGADLLNVVGKKAVQVVLPEFRKLAAELEQIKQSMTAVHKKQELSASDVFFSKLDGLVPDWRDLNDDPKFVSWLIDSDIKPIFDAAASQFNFRSIAKYFNLYKQLSGGTQAQDTQTQLASNRQQELEKQAAPSKPKASGSAKTETQGKVWSRADIAKFYADKARGAYRGRDTEAQKIEQDIFAAQREGRIEA
jgi:hypothetical protein